MNSFELLILALGFAFILAFIVVMIWQSFEKLKQIKVNKKMKEINNLPLEEKKKLLTMGDEDIKEVTHGEQLKRNRTFSKLREDATRERTDNGRIATAQELTGSERFGHLQTDASGVGRTIAGIIEQSNGSSEQPMGNAEGDKPQVRNVSPKIEF